MGSARAVHNLRRWRPARYEPYVVRLTFLRLRSAKLGVGGGVRASISRLGAAQPRSPVQAAAGA